MAIQRSILAAAALAAATWLVSPAAAPAQTFKEPVTGKARLERTRPGGTFVFERGIEGEATVAVRAPGGSISFPNRDRTDSPPSTQRGSKIDGRSVVLLEAKTVTINSKIDGASTVLAIVSRGGALTLTETASQSHVFWCKAADDDPDVAFTQGQIHGGSHVVRVARAEMDRLVKLFEAGDRKELAAAMDQLKVKYKQ
jgi:hypothetical protein